MTVFEKLKSMNIDELAAYIKENWMHDNDPVLTWWDKSYCSKCDSEDDKYAWCEIHSKCKYFPEMNKLPNCLEMIMIWLRSEVKSNG